MRPHSVADAYLSANSFAPFWIGDYLDRWPAFPVLSRFVGAMSCRRAVGIRGRGGGVASCRDSRVCDGRRS